MQKSLSLTVTMHHGELGALVQDVLFFMQEMIIPLKANDTILTLAMIETKKAVDNLDKILRVEGLDAIFVGPSDLGLSLGYTPCAHHEVDLLKAIEMILNKTKSNSKKAGIYTLTTDYAKKMIKLGL